MVARVPGIDKVRASDIGVVQTTLPQVSEKVDFGVGAKGLTKLGQTISSEAEQLAQVGIINQRRDEAREVQARTLRFRQDIFDNTYGNKDKGIVGISERRGQDALDNASGHKTILDELALANLNEVTNPQIRTALKLEMQQEQVRNSGEVGKFISGQRREAEKAVRTADASHTFNEIMKNPNDPANWIDTPTAPSRMTHLVDLTLEEADAQGITDQQQRENMVKGQLTSLHTAVVKQYLDNNDAAGARAYLSQGFVQSSLFQKEKAELTKLVRQGSVLEAAQQETDIIFSTARTDTEKRKAAREIKNPEVREKTMSLVSQRITATNADEKNRSRDIIAGARREVEGGKTPDELDTETQIVIDQTLGLRAALDKRALQVLSGRPAISDDKMLGALTQLQIKDKDAFLELDFNDPKYIAGLSPSDARLMRSRQLTEATSAAKLNRSELARQERLIKADEKEKQKASRITRALSASRAIIKGFDIQGEELGIFTSAFTTEIERRVELGDTLKDSDYQDIARGLYLQGEHRERGTFGFKPNIKFFEAISSGTPFDISDFTSDNKEFINKISRETNIHVTDTAKLIASLITAGRGVPTAATVLRELERQKRIRGIK